MLQSEDISYYNCSAVTAQKNPRQWSHFFYKTLSPFQDTAAFVNLLCSPLSYVITTLNLHPANAVEVPLHSLPDAEPI